jgi:hypothetical protein
VLSDERGPHDGVSIIDVPAFPCCCAGGAGLGDQWYILGMRLFPVSGTRLDVKLSPEFCAGMLNDTDGLGRNDERGLNEAVPLGI